MSTRGYVSRVDEHFDKAVAGLRAAGAQEFIARGLLARAAHHRSRLTDGDPEAEVDARRDLDEALALAERCGMKLHGCDAHLELARLELALGDTAAARPHITTAARLIEATGYERRRSEFDELRDQAPRPPDKPEDHT